METATPSTIQDVLSGNTPIKVTVSIDYYSAAIFGLAIMVAVGVALVIYKKV